MEPFTDRTFHLTNEFGEEGPGQLTALLAVSTVTVAWGPICPLIAKAHETGRSLLSPKGFIALLERDDGPLKVMARPEWILDRDFRRRHPWEPARLWRDDFDGEIFRLAREDENKPAVDRRVILSDRDHGWDRAYERLAKNDRSRLLRRLGALFSKGHLPPGIQQRAVVNKQKNGRHPAESILRDILDHEDAIKDSGSSMTSLDPLYASFMQALAGMGVSLSVPATSQDEPQTKTVDLDGVADVIRGLTPITTEKHFIRFLCSSEQRRAFRQLAYLPQQVPLRSELLRRLNGVARQGPLYRGLVRDLYPGFSSKNPIDVSLTAWEVVTQVLSAIAGPMSLVPTGVRIGKVSLQRLGVLPIELRPEDRDLECLFYLCFATRRPTIKQVERLIRSLVHESEVARTSPAGQPERSDKTRIDGGGDRHH